MDRAHIDEHHVIDRYVRGALHEVELEAFECYILDHPEIIEDIEFAKAMQSAIARNPELLDVPPVKVGARAVSPGFLFGRGYAMAATVLLAVAIPVTGYLVNDTRDLRSQLSYLDRPSSVSSEIVFEQTRGESTTTISFPEEGSLLLRIDVGPEYYDVYSISITNESGYEWIGSRVAAGIAQTIGVVVPWLSPGVYTLMVTAELPSGDTRPVAQYRFAVDDEKQQSQ